MNTLFKLFLIALTLLACAKRRENFGGGDNLSGLAGNFGKVTNSREVLNYYGVALNYNTGADNTLLTEYNNLYPTLPQNGDSAYTSTVSRMFTNFAFRICRNSLNNELGLPAGNRVVYKFVNLSQRPDVVAGTDLEARMGAFIRSIAFRLYGAPIPEDEYTDVFSFYSSQRFLVTQDAAGAQDLAVQICALLGTSPRAIMKM